MKFQFFRCLGIIALGIAGFFSVLILALMFVPYYWDAHFAYLRRDYTYLLYGYFISLVLAAIFLSTKQEKKELDIGLSEETKEKE